MIKPEEKNGEQYASLVNKSRNERNEQYEKENNHHEYKKQFQSELTIDADQQL